MAFQKMVQAGRRAVSSNLGKTKESALFSACREEAIRNACHRGKC